MTEVKPADGIMPRVAEETTGEKSTVTYGHKGWELLSLAEDGTVKGDRQGTEHENY